MFKGFTDGMDLRNADLDTIKRALDKLKLEINFNNLTFYPGGDRERQQRIYRHIRGLGVTTGVMLQLLSTTKTEENADQIIGVYSDEKNKDIEREWGKPVTTVHATRDYADERFVPYLLDQVRSALQLCPDLDFIFLEYEGVNFVRQDQIRAWYDRWARANDRPPSEHVVYADEILDHLRRIHRPRHLLWSNEYLAMAGHFHRRNFTAVETMLAHEGCRAQLGVVYHLYGSEAPLFSAALPSPDWWLLPWHYWTFELPGTAAAEIADKKAVGQESLARWKQAGHKVCYIGDVALGKNGLGHVAEFYDYATGIGLDGYMGLGLPDAAIGVHWAGVEDSDINAARELYRRLY